MGSADSLPTGTVTFLLTDVEGSTRAWERDPVATASLITLHYDMLDGVIAGHGGRRPVEQGEGDSVVAAFARATDAVAAAFDAQQRLAAVGVAVRMAVHTGEIELRDGGNYFGPTIIRCARLRAIGHGGQVLVSDATRLLVGDRLPAGAALLDLGSHRLKDLSQPERVWQLGCSDESVSFPPLRSLDAFGHNLPTRLTPLIGRVVETAEITALVRGERLVTLVGPGGVGKTRLALHAAAEFVGETDGGVWWVDLAPVSGAGAAAGAVLAALGTVERRGAGAAVSIGEQLAGRSAVFVLDNCEHLVEECASFVDELLGVAASVRILATSREPLGVSGETVWRVPSLAVPALADARSTVEAVLRSDAGRLFLDRARRVRQGLVVDDEVADAVARICAQLDGIALAIELAAARCRSLGVTQIAAELDDRFRLLTGGARTVLARQQTLKASLDWSHDLLGDAERTAFRRLGVFAGGFPLEAAETVIGTFGDIAAVEVLDLVDRLVDKSLVTLEPGGVGDGTRFRLLETMRHYALDRLVDAGELAAARDAHVDFWASWASAHSLYAAGDVADLAAVINNVADLTAATRWACTARTEHVATLILAVGLHVRLDENSTGMGLFPVALAALDSVDEAGWAHVLGVAALAMSLTWVVVPDTEDRDRAQRIAVAYDLPLVAASVTFGVALADPALWQDTFRLFVRGGAPGWAAVSAALGSRVAAGVGDAAGARTLLACFDEIDHPGDLGLWQAITARVVRGIVWGEHLADLAVAAAQQLRSYSSIDRSYVRTGSFGTPHESLSRAAFFARDRELLEWAAATLADDARSPVDRRYATLAATHLALVDGPPGPSSTLRERLGRSMTGGGLNRRETAYLAVAAADRDWMRDEREFLAGFGGSVGPLLPCYRSLLDGALAVADDDDRAAKTAWHTLLAAAAENGFVLLQIDALEGLAITAARTGSHDEAARLSGAADAARDQVAYRYRYPHLAALPEASDEGRSLTLADAIAYARRARGERRRPTTGWDALTPTEALVVRAVADGLTNQEAAERLFMSVPTVKTHLRHVFDKLAISSRSQLAAVVVDHPG